MIQHAPRKILHAFQKGAPSPKLEALYRVGHPKEDDWRISLRMLHFSKNTNQLSVQLKRAWGRLPCMRQRVRADWDLRQDMSILRFVQRGEMDHSGDNAAQRWSLYSRRASDSSRTVSSACIGQAPCQQALRWLEGHHFGRIEKSRVGESWLDINFSLPPWPVILGRADGFLHCSSGYVGHRVACRTCAARRGSIWVNRYQRGGPKPGGWWSTASKCFIEWESR